MPYYGHIYYGYGDFLANNLYVLLLIPVLLLSLWAQFQVSGSFRRYNAVNNRRHLTGAQAAEAVLRRRGLERVTLAAPVLERLPEPEAARCRKMFGEYMVYLNDRPVLLVCDNTVFVKRLPELADLMKSAPTGVPYSGSKEHYILDMDDTERAAAVLAVLERVTPLPKPRKKKG